MRLASFRFVLHREDGSDCGGLRSLRSLRPLPQSTSSRYRGTCILRAPPPARVRGWTRLLNHCYPPSWNKGIKNNQNVSLLFPHCIGDFIPENDSLRVLDAIVEHLDISATEATYKGGGASSFAPRMLLKVILYAYLQNIHCELWPGNC